MGAIRYESMCVIMHKNDMHAPVALQKLYIWFVAFELSKIKI